MPTLREFETTDPIFAFAGAYGPRWREGILIDHVDAAQRAGHVLVRTGSGHGWMHPATGGRAIRVVCGELIKISTEDGPVSGRCGAPALLDTGRCDVHDVFADDDDDDGQAASSRPSGSGSDSAKEVSDGAHH